MPPRSSRIPRKLLAGITKSSKRLFSRHFTIFLAPNQETQGPKVAVSVSKKVSKKAVVRNRVRRQAYNFINTILPQLPNKLFLISAKPGAEKLKFKDLSIELAELIKKS